ncbi:MAG: hypothetical protein ABS46_00240 [Cytophagaceae bacterium SCN 52-12]|nr:MAG: hypothetical protein ABS46_00240 [Cytophagaceae bacterium SCN 52-12]
MSGSFLKYLFLMLAGAGAYGQSARPLTVFLKEPLPVDGAVAALNPVVLRWPYQKGDGVTYEVRLSMDSLFSKTPVWTADGLPGAIYNPCRLLEKGTWYWQYRVSGKSWSKRLKFLMPENAAPVAAPAPHEFLSAIPPGHPRILVDRPGQEVRSLAKQEEAQAILEEAEHALAVELVVESENPEGKPGLTPQQAGRLRKDAVVRSGHRIRETVIPLCQAYLLTGDKRYRDKAIALAMQISSWDPDGITSQSDFTDGISMYGMALVFDTFYDDLSGEQKAQLSRSAGIRAARFYDHWVNNIESKVLSGHVWQLLLNEFFKTALALYGHEDEAARWLSYAYGLFLGRTPVLGGIDGGWAEGASYFRMNIDMLVEIPEKIKRYTGFDFISSHPWYRNQADWLIYQVPPGGSADGFGDNTEELLSTPPFFAAYADVMGRLLNDSRFRWYLQKMRELREVDLAKEPVLRWHRLIYPGTLSENLPEKPPALPMARIFREAGIASLHTNPSEPEHDIMVAFRASPYGAYGHAHADQNTFNVMVDGKRLFFRTGYKVAMNDPHRLGWSMHTKAHNGILINGEGQPYSIEAGGRIRHFLQGKTLAYVAGDASGAYRSKEKGVDTGLRKFRRHIILLKPGILVVYDELEADKPAVWSWLIHSLEHMSADTAGSAYTGRAGNATGTGKLWAPGPLSWSLKNKFDVPAVSYRTSPGKVRKAYNDDQWHLTATSASPARIMRFLSVIRISRDADEMIAFKDLSGSGDSPVVEAGAWKISATLSGERAPSLRISSVSGDVIFSVFDEELKAGERVFRGRAAQSPKLLEITPEGHKLLEAEDFIPDF